MTDPAIIAYTTIGTWAKDISVREDIEFGSFDYRFLGEGLADTRHTEDGTRVLRGRSDAVREDTHANRRSVRSRVSR